MSNKETMKPEALLSPRGETDTMETAIEGIRRMFVDKVQHDHIVDERQTPARRAAFIKQHGSAHGVFQVVDNLDKKYQVGIFQPGARFEAWVRYSSDVPDERPDKNTTVGIGIKLFGVPGDKALEEDVKATTLDFILQNTEVFFAADAIEMVEFKAAALNGTLDAFLQDHPETARILDEMGKRTVESVLTEPLWSCIPYQFGEHDYCKFVIRTQSVAEPDAPADKEAPGYLAKDMQERLYNGEVRLDFYVQLRNNPDTQSITSARSLWKEDEAVPVKVATLILPQQNILARGQGTYGETLSYNIWRTLPALKPIGSIADARKVVYRSSAQVRRNVNGQSIAEPSEPRLPGAPTPPYQPTFEQPWPPAKAQQQDQENTVTENFDAVAELLLEKNKYHDYQYFAVSTRDMQQSVRITDTQHPVAGITAGKVIHFDNTARRQDTLRIVFHPAAGKVKRVRFSVSVAFDNPVFAMHVKALDDKDMPVTMDIALLQGEGRATIEADPGKTISALAFHCNEQLASLELDDFRITYVA